MQEENLNEPLLNNHQRINVPQPQIINAEPLPYAPVPENEIARRQSFHERLMEVFNQQPQEPIAGPDLELLNRVSYQNERERMSFYECSICLQPFSEYQNERLIYLPCSRQHIFHSKCILDWLNHDTNCPLCRYPINRNTILNEY